MAQEIPNKKILACLRRRGRALTDREIGRTFRKMAAGPDTVTSAVDALIANGLLRTVALARDRVTGNLVRKVWFASQPTEVRHGQ